MNGVASPDVKRQHGSNGLRHMLALGALSTVSACGGRWPAPGTPAAAAEWPAAMVGAWALVEPATRAGVADTTVWVLRASGALEHHEVQVRPRVGALAARERTVATSRWWTKERAVGGLTTRVVCMSQQPGRNSQCAQVTIDTVPGAGGARLRRLTWTGVTFRTQHWTFMERALR